MTDDATAVSVPDLSGLRILAFCDHYPPSETGGGAERVAHEVYRRLAAAGARITVIAAVPAGVADAVETAAAVNGAVETATDGQRVADGTVEEAGSLEVVRVTGRDLSRLTGAQVLAATGLLGHASRAVERLGPHVLHANSLHFQSTVAAARLARRTGLPLVTTVHVAGIERLPAPVRGATAVWEQTVGRFVLRSSRTAIAVSDSVAAHVASRGMSPERIRVVPNGVDLARFVPGETTEPPTVAFVGRLIANKGPETLVAAAAMLAGRGVAFRLVLAGDGPQRRELEARVAASPALAERTTFTGFISDVAGVLAGATVLARPSLTEGMPLAVLEAMAAGAVVVASDIPANRELVHHDRTGLLVPVGDVDALGAAIERLVGDPELVARLAGAGRRVADGHAWEVTAARTADVLVEATGRTGTWR